MPGICGKGIPIRCGLTTQHTQHRQHVSRKLIILIPTGQAAVL